MRSGARIVTISALLLSVACVMILHLLRSDLPPAAHRLSEYANGPYGWVMTLAFVALGCGLMGVGVTVWAGRRDRLGWTILVTASVAAAGTFLSGAYRTAGSDSSKVLHSRASAVAVLAAVALALLYSIPAARHRPGARTDPVGAGLALTAAALALVSPLLHHTAWTGLSQRLLWIALTTWLLRAAWRGLEASKEWPETSASELPAHRT
jgi:drug/metabolite transporter (DMT)-like permease